MRSSQTKENRLIPFYHLNMSFYAAIRRNKTLLYGLTISSILLFTSIALFDFVVSKHSASKFNRLREVASDYTFLLEARIKRGQVNKKNVEGLRTVDRNTKKISDAKNAKPSKPPKVTVKDTTKGSSKDEPLKAVWLMSYPFSGSTVALRIVQDYTGYSMATNYGDIVDTNRGFVADYYGSQPIWTNGGHGPFKYRIDKPLPPPGSYILVKTHCAGYCIDVGDDECKFRDYMRYLSTVRDFFMACGSGTKYSEKGRFVEEVEYDPWQIKKVMMLVRDPLEIIVARFNNVIEGEPSFQKSFKTNNKGLTEWCNVYDNRHGSQTMQNWFSDEVKALAMSGNVTCYAELYRITKFYDQAFKVIGLLDLPVHVVRFEDYDNDLGGNIYGMINFLEYTTQNNQRRAPFEKLGDDGYPFLDETQIAYMVEFINLVASQETKELFEPYI